MRYKSMNISRLCTLLFILLTILNETSSEEQNSLAISLDDATVEDEESTTPGTADTVEDNSEIFVAEKDWKDVKEGQAVPAGLHIRMNLQTGRKEAKLLDEPQPKIENKFKIDELKKILNNIKADDIVSAEEQVNTDGKFKTMETLQKEFKELNLNVETDTEIMKRLLRQLNDTKSSDNDRFASLLELEYFVHQIDNALNLIELNGLDVIVPLLNSTNSELRSSAAFVLGSAMQSNTKFKIAILERNVLPQLLRMIAFEQFSSVKNRAMYALSCLVRQFPHAQQRMVKSGALSVFKQLFEEKNNQADPKIKKKIVTLITNLIQEKALALNVSKPDDNQKERARQYQQLKIKEHAVQVGFCKIIPSLLPSEEHDTRECVVDAMLMFHDECRDEFSSLSETLQELNEQYKGLSEEEKLEEDYDSDAYFTVLHRNIKTLLSKFRNTVKEEL